MNSTIDVALRLRLDYQKRSAEAAERDLKELKNAADRIGKSRGGDELSRDLRSIGSNADEAKRKIGAIGTGFADLKGDARAAAAAIGTIKQEATEAKAAIGRVDDGAFAGLKSDAAGAKAAIAEVGQAAAAAEQKIRQMRNGYSTMTTPGGRLIADGRWQTQTHAPRSGAVTSAAEGALDQFGVPIALGAGSAYLVGALPAGAAVAGGAAIRAAAGDEFTLDQLQVTGGFGDDVKARYDEMFGRAGAKYGVGKQGAMNVFGALQAGGLEHADAAAMTEDVIRFAKATQADPTDAANTATALRNNMKIAPGDLPAVYDAMAIGGKEGKFEIPDMARHFPSMLAAMAAQGSTGAGGVNLATAMIQSIMKSSGSADQAKTAFEAMLTDMVSPDVVDRASKYGVDVFKTKRKAEAAGEDPVMALIRSYYNAVGGNEEKMRDLFRNSEAYKGYAAVFRDIDELDPMMGRMVGGRGTIDKDYGGATDNLQSQGERLSSNVGQNIKDLAAPILPVLTAIARTVAEQMERARENQTKNPLSNVPGHEVTEGLMKFWLSNSASAGPGQPTGWQRFLFGAGADKDFNLRDHLGVDLRPTAQDSMKGYNDALAAEGEKASAEAQSIADRIKAWLGFTVSPTIAPTYVPPPGAPAAAGQQSSIQPMSNRTTQYITSPNPQHAALRANRLQARQIQQAQARSLYDTGRRLA